MTNPSIWQVTGRPAPFPPAMGDLEADVAIVGGGITGVTTAMLLARAGKSVVVIEARTVGSGTTGNSTGNLYAVAGNGLAAIEHKWGEERMKLVARSRSQAVDLVEATVASLGIECGFSRAPFHQFVMPAAEADSRELDKELDCARRAGLDARIDNAAPLPFKTGSCLVIERQAQLHPLDYVVGLAQRIASGRVRIVEGTEVIGIDHDKRVLTTTRGKVTAQRIVLATHTPKGFNLVQTELGPYREYGVAAEVSAPFPAGIFWSLEATRHSLRALEHGGRHYAMVIGHKHKTGQEPDTPDCYAALEAWLRQHVPIGAIAARWSAQGYYPADGIAYIGRTAASADAYLATGFGADGLTYGTLAAMIIADDILDRENDYAPLYEATRVKPIKAGKKFVTENANVAAEYVKDYAGLLHVADFTDVAPGEGRIMEVRGKRCAVARGDDGELKAVSPICTHLKCVVHWNSAERSWDCPCHGSRFAPDGSVLEGPAPVALERFVIDAAQRAA